MGGDRPENRKAQYKKNKQREEGGGGGGGDSERRKGDGKPVKVKGMTYEKQVPAFIAKMMQNGANKDRSKPDIAAHDVLPTMSERAARGGGGGEQWPAREPEGAASRPPTDDEVEEARAQAAATAREEEEQRRRDAAAAVARQRDEQARYKAGHGVQAADGQMRVILTKRKSAPVVEGHGGEAEETAAAEGKPKKKKKKKAKTVNKSLLSFDEDD
jgi:hypothetical protein